MALACALSLAAEAPSELEVEAPAGLVEADGLERLIDLAMYLAALAPARKRTHLSKLGFGGGYAEGYGCSVMQSRNIGAFGSLL